MTFDALVFDVDGTLADTEELHRQAFNEAFFACGINWRWGPALYADLLQITGGKERIASFLSQQRVSAAERGRPVALTVATVASLLVHVMPVRFIFTGVSELVAVPFPSSP